ncbi:MAG: hypothetical protein EOO61_03380 [Hymenobacter sp.]|nr:MAG: hypothetical protein EOO61_03380 [Hymenobacter sp.]
MRNSHACSDRLSSVFHTTLLWRNERFPASITVRFHQTDILSDGTDLTGSITDAEKGKYFQVQANHIAPQGAKYSHENVRKEKEQSRVSLTSSG